MAMADTYAIVETGGKQYRAQKGTKLLVERLPDDEGAKVNLRAVMFRGDKDVVLAADELEKVKVEAVVAEHLRGTKVRIFKYKAKKGYRRRAGHRQELTRLEVVEVKLLARKPAAAAKAKPAAEAADKPEAKPKAPAKAKAPAKPKAAAKKPAAKKPAAKKPAAKKPAASKASTAKKPAAKKPTTRKSSSSGSTRKTSSTRTKKES
jgi:large subunit ribosomal protein L21